MKTVTVNNEVRLGELEARIEGIDIELKDCEVDSDEAINLRGERDDLEIKISVLKELEEKE